MPERVGPPVDPGPSIWTLPDPADAADADGIVGVGADLEAATLVDAYRRGVFPWPHEGWPGVPWFSPDPRGIVWPAARRVSRTLRQRLRRTGWHTTVDTAFDDVIEACAERGEDEGTWISPDMCTAYRRLHRLGWARSVEVWDGDELVGGLYGVHVGGIFTGESMFHRSPDASKVAFVDLADRFFAAGGTAIDVQLMTDHLASLGATATPRREYLALLAAHVDDDVRPVSDPLPVARLASFGNH
jgi:leucyl/phenylalanyl-tRNA---protein transferase